MKQINLTDWAIDKIKREYPEDVALLVGVEGRSVNGDGHGECFGYFVPATERGLSLSQTFIIDGVGHDLYPRTWERNDRTADLEERSPQCLGDAVILYSRSDEDKNRFLAQRQRMSDHLKDREYTYKKALELLDMAMDLYRTMMFEDALYRVRMAAGYVYQYLCRGVAFLNGTFRTDRMDTLEALPEHFLDWGDAVLRAQTAEELKHLTHLIIHTTRRFLEQQKPVKDAQTVNQDYKQLADWYQEISLWWRRLRFYCDTADTANAFQEACQLQAELNIVGAEFGLEEMDLLGCYQADRLSVLRERGDRLEQAIIEAIEGHGVRINQYKTLEEFLENN